MRCLVLYSALMLAVPAAAQVTLESSDHDLLRLTPGDGTFPDVALPPVIGNRVVAVCLGNGTGAAKGLDNRQGDEPRTIAVAGQTVCARWEPTGHVAYFYKKTETGWMLVLTYRLDLRDRDGSMFYLDWLRD